MSDKVVNLKAKLYTKKGVSEKQIKQPGKDWTFWCKLKKYCITLSAFASFPQRLGRKEGWKQWIHLLCIVFFQVFGVGKY